MCNKTTAVFDFDGTIISHDTAHEFNLWLIRRSLFRTVIMSGYFPLFLLLHSIPVSRRFSLNVGCFIATAGQRSSIFALRSAFYEHLFNTINATIYQDAIDCVKKHKRNGDKIVILSGCPKWLLKPICQKAGIDVDTFICSPQHLFLSGIILTEHCYGPNKLRLAKLAGENFDHWHHGYSDSPSDLPMLENCRKSTLVNMSESKVKRLLLKLNSSTTQVNWH